MYEPKQIRVGDTVTINYEQINGNGALLEPTLSTLSIFCTVYKLINIGEPAFKLKSTLGDKVLLLNSPVNKKNKPYSFIEDEIELVCTKELRTKYFNGEGISSSDKEILQWQQEQRLKEKGSK